MHAMDFALEKHKLHTHIPWYSTYVLGFVFITFKRHNEQWVINGKNCAQNDLEYYFFYRKLCLCCMYVV